MSTLADFSAVSIDGREVDLSSYAGSVVLVVNTASECGFTPQFEGLQQLHEKLADQGLVVLGFPCDQFGHQEPGTEEQIASFCQRNYGVTFPMFSKIEVNGDDAHPLFTWLRSESSHLKGAPIEWNFAKFLVGRDGQLIKSYSTSKEPAALAADIEQALTA